MTTEDIDLDLILHGRAIPAADRRLVELNYEQGIRVRVPELRREDLESFFAGASEIQRSLARLTIREVTEFLAAVGSAWLDESSPWRRFAQRYAPRLTGYHPAMLANDYFLLGEFISAPSSLYDQVRAELGHEHIFDEWIPVHASYNRAYGLGVAVHILVGNLPLAGLYSIVRGVATRNVNLAKLPTRDPVSTYAFVRSMIDMDPDHPVTRAISLAYWERDSDIGELALRRADVAIVWGGRDTISAIGRMAAGTPLILFGPRWSASVIDLDAVDPRKAAVRLAFEMGYYDQEACFSTQKAFIRGDVESFVPVLAEAVRRFSTAMPLVTTNRDALAHRTASLLEADYRGWARTGAGDASIVVLPPEAELHEHPLTRTLYIQPVEDLDAIAPCLNREMQTLCVYPWSLASQYRDVWTQAGAERVVELGMSRHPREGFTHDGMRWLNQLVRMACVERPTTQLYRYNTLSPEGFETWLFERHLAAAGS